MLRIIVAASFSLMLIAAPVAQAVATTGKHPGASAALGTIYFSSVLKDAGIGSGISSNSGVGGRSSTNYRGSAPKHFDGASTARSPLGSGTTGGNGDQVDVASGGNTAPGGNSGNGPIATGPSSVKSSPGGSDRTTEIFGDISPRDSDRSNGGIKDPWSNFPGHDGHDGHDRIFPPSPTLPDIAWPYLPSETVETPTIVSSVRIVQVPEPTSAMLFGVGLAGLLLLMRGRSKATQ